MRRKELDSVFCRYCEAILRAFFDITMKRASVFDDVYSKLAPTNWLLMRLRSKCERIFLPHGCLHRITEIWSVKSNLKPMSEQVFPLCQYLSNTAHCLLSFPLPRFLSPFSFLSPYVFCFLLLAHPFLISLVSLFPTTSRFPPLVPLLPFPRMQQPRGPGSLIALGNC